MEQLKTILGSLRKLLGYAAELTEKRFRIPADIISDAEDAKKGGKQIVGVHYVASQFDATTPDGPQAAKALVTDIQTTLRKKGWGKSWHLPKPMTEVLAVMARHAVPSKKTATDKGGEGSGSD